jgi:hypothetical protein
MKLQSPMGTRSDHNTAGSGRRMPLVNDHDQHLQLFSTGTAYRVLIAARCRTDAPDPLRARTASSSACLKEGPTPVSFGTLHTNAWARSSGADGSAVSAVIGAPESAERAFRGSLHGDNVRFCVRPGGSHARTA